MATRLEWTIDRRSQPALALSVLSLSRLAGKEVDSAVRETEDGETPCSLTVRDASAGEGEAIASWRIRLDGASLSFEGLHGAAGATIPVAIAPTALGCPRLVSARIVFSAAEPAERRIRMTLRTAAELTRRGASFRIVACGPAGDVPSKGSVDEEHRDLTPIETLALVRSCAAILDCADEEEDTSSLALTGAAAGVSVITHRSAPLAGWGFDSVTLVEGWSADAFADAIQGRSEVPDKSDERANAALRALFEVLGHAS